MRRSWDVAISPWGDKAAIALPVDLARSLAERGMWRTEITITDQGLLFRPYVIERGKGRRLPDPVELPDWDDAE